MENPKQETSYDILKNIFLTGLIIFIPLVLTLTILRIGFDFLDGLLRPFFRGILGDVEGLGIISIIITIMVIGVLARISKRLIEKFERIIFRIPVIGGIYFTIKETSEIFLLSKDIGQTIVLVEFPQKGTYSIGFTIGKTNKEFSKKLRKDYINVFMPTTPNPTTGFMLVTPKNKVKPLRMGMDEAFKLLLTGGLTIPKK